MDEGRIGKFVIGFETVKGLSLLAASQNKPKSHGTIWNLQTIKLLFFPPPPFVFLRLNFLKKLLWTFVFVTPRQEGQRSDQIPPLLIS